MTMRLARQPALMNPLESVLHGGWDPEDGLNRAKRAPIESTGLPMATWRLTSSVSPGGRAREGACTLEISAPQT